MTGESIVRLVDRFLTWGFSMPATTDVPTPATDEPAPWEQDVSR